MKATKQIDIYLTQKRNVRLIDVVQYDTGIQLVFTVKDFTIPSGSAATLYVQKPSGKFVFQEDNITISGSIITIDLENQAITEYGKVPYQVGLKNGTDEITSFTGLMMVEQSKKDAGATESVTVIRAFDEAVSDHLAEFQTKAEQIVQACIATIPEDYTVMEAKVNELANAVKGYLSGAVVFADDVSPVEHCPVVKVHGKNLVPYGTITFTRNKSYLLDNPLPAGTYTISAYITSSDTDSDYSAVSINSKSEVMKYIALKRGNRVSSTFTVDKPITNIDFCSAYNYSQGEGDTATWSDIQIEEGSVATDYEAYIDPSTVTVSRCGRNLIPKITEPINVQAGGITQVISTNGAVKINGTATAPAYLFVSAIYNLPKAVYHLTGNTSDECLLIASAYNGEAYVFEAQDRGSGVILDLTDKTFDHVRVMMYVPTGNTVGKTIYPMLNIEQAGTEYENPKEVTTHIPSSDGTVSGVTSLSPNMTILTDTEGVIVECEYNRDTNKVIDKLINAITALGGTV
jgi:hypothetical protein